MLLSIASEKNTNIIVENTSIDWTIPKSVGDKYLVYKGSKKKLAILGKMFPNVYIDVFFINLDIIS